MRVGLLLIEVNWEPSVIPCKKIRITLGSYEQIIDHDEFFSMMFLFGNEAEQERNIKITETEMRIVERMISVRAQKDMKTGEVLSFPYKYAIPESEYQKLKELHPNSIRLADES